MLSGVVRRRRSQYQGVGIRIDLLFCCIMLSFTNAEWLWFGEELQLQLQPNRGRSNGLDKILDRVFVRSIKLGRDTEDRGPRYYRGRQQSDSSCQA